MQIYNLLLNNRRPHLIAPSREYLFLQENELVLSTIPDLYAFVNVKDEFSLICANIVIESIFRYRTLKDYYESHTSDDSIPLEPLFNHKGVPIYCPLFSVSNNLLIHNKKSMNLNLQNDMIDLFETYNFDLFESNLTSLVLIGQDDHTRAYYHYDFHTIYIVNEQGRLDVRISLFDKHIRKPDFRNILERVKNVIENYYGVDRLGFLNAMFNEKLISQKIYNQYMSYLRRKRLL